MRQLHEKGPSELPKGLSPGPAAGPFSPEKKSCVLYFSTCLAGSSNPYDESLGFSPTSSTFSSPCSSSSPSLPSSSPCLPPVGNEKRSLTAPSPRRESPPLRLHNHAEYRSGP